jgi:hypothetical protein
MATARAILLAIASRSLSIGALQTAPPHTRFNDICKKFCHWSRPAQFLDMSLLSRSSDKLCSTNESYCQGQANSLQANDVTHALSEAAKLKH